MQLAFAIDSTIDPHLSHEVTFSAVANCQLSISPVANNLVIIKMIAPLIVSESTNETAKDDEPSENRLLIGYANVLGQ